MKFTLQPLDRQVLVITGASSGIGLATARLAVKRGARVMLVSRNGEALADIVRDLGSEAADYAVADVGVLEQVQAAADAAVARFGRIDSWVSNAGVAIYARLLDTPDDEHVRMFQTNYFGAVHSAAAAVPHLRKAGGALIVVGSIAGELPSPILGAYAASKHAVKGFVGSLRMELEADGAPISVTLIKPSGIDTPIAQHAAAHVEGQPMVPQPAYKPELVAEAILFAAEHPRREMTVGGGGRAQVLLGTHFPRLLDRMSPVLEAVLAKAGPPRETAGNLDAPLRDGAMHSGDTPALRHSLHDTADRHRGAALAIGGAALLAGLAAWRFRRN